LIEMIAKKAGLMFGFFIGYQLVSRFI